MEYKPSARDEAERTYDEALDRLVHTRNCSYDEARGILGTPPYETVEIATTVLPRVMGAAAIRRVGPRRRRRNGNGPQYGEEEAYAGEELPYYYAPYEPLSDEQRAINARGHQQALEALAAARATKPGKQ